MALAVGFLGELALVSDMIYEAWQAEKTFENAMAPQVAGLWILCDGMPTGVMNLGNVSSNILMERLLGKTFSNSGGWITCVTCSRPVLAARFETCNYRPECCIYLAEQSLMSWV